MTPASVSSCPSATRRAWLPTAALAAFLLPASGLRAQAPGTLDPTFNAGTGVSTVYALDHEKDAGGAIKVTVGGDRALGDYELTTDSSGNFVEPTGLADANFLLAPFGNAARIIYTIVPESAVADGSSFPNLLIGGSFDGGLGRTFNGNKVPQNIVRIAPDGSFDQGFSLAVGTGANGFVTSILPQQDGRIVVGGLFTAFNKQPRRRIVRLLQSGGIDTSFGTGSNIDNDVLALAESIDPANPGVPDGSTLVGGTFNRVAGQAYGKLVRLDPNGNLDMSFHPSIDLRVLAILVQDDGKIIIGGDFTTVNGVKVQHLARLTHEGALDLSFVGGVTGVPNNDVNPTAVYVLRPIIDGRIYVGGEFAQINGAPRQYLGLINENGAVDTTFAPPAKTIFNSVQSIAVQSDGNVLVGETLGPRVNDKFPPSLIRVYGVGVAAAPSPATAAKTSPQAVQKETQSQTVAPSSREHAAASRRYIW